MEREMDHRFLWLGAVAIGGIIMASFILYGTAGQAGEAPAMPLRQTVAVDMNQVVPIIKPEELRDELASAQPPVLLDVREPAEREVAKIGHDANIPLGELSQRYVELPKDKPIVVYCRSGRRSARAVELLQEKGFTKVKNLDGGINAWSSRIHTSSCPEC
jgi:rhodanese-related sulfurtransferase